MTSTLDVVLDQWFDAPKVHGKLTLRGARMVRHKGGKGKKGKKRGGEKPH